MVGTALFLMRRRWPTHRAVPALGVCVAAIALLSITGYVFSADPLYSLPSATAIAFQTATVLFTIGLALVAVATDRQPLKSLLEDSAAGELARRGLPIVTLVPILIGCLCARGQRLGVFDSTLAMALLVLSLIGTLCVVLWAGVVAVAKREQSLRMSEDRFTRFMQHLPGLAWIKDGSGRYVYVNEAAVQAFRLPKDRLYGKKDAEVFDPTTARQFQDNDQKALESGNAVQVIEKLSHEDGVVHHSIVSKFPIPSADG
jgi:PAS domain S-box-containing protein